MASVRNEGNFASIVANCGILYFSAIIGVNSSLPKGAISAFSSFGVLQSNFAFLLISFLIVAGICLSYLFYCYSAERAAELQERWQTIEQEIERLQRVLERSKPLLAQIANHLQLDVSSLSSVASVNLIVLRRINAALKKRQCQLEACLAASSRRMEAALGEAEHLAQMPYVFRSSAIETVGSIVVPTILSQEIEGFIEKFLQEMQPEIERCLHLQSRPQPLTSGLEITTSNVKTSSEPLSGQSAREIEPVLSMERP